MTRKETVTFAEVFAHFSALKGHLKVIHVASASPDSVPNSAPKMLIETTEPNIVYYLDYKQTQTHKNLMQNKKLSISIMDEPKFVGYRLNGSGEMLEDQEEINRITTIWENRLIKYEAERMVERIKGNYSTREAENLLPKEFEIIKFKATEGAFVKPDRILRFQSES